MWHEPNKLKPQPGAWYLPAEPAGAGVMRQWTRKLTMRMQAVLVAAVRGCDGSPKHDPSKTILWALRFDILNPSYHGDDLNPYTFRSFMGYTETEAVEQSAIQHLLRSLDQYPLHFIMHLTHAAEIAGRFHPDQSRRAVWLNFYRTVCREHLHTNPETQKQLERRLRDR